MTGFIDYCAAFRTEATVFRVVISLTSAIGVIYNFIKENNLIITKLMNRTMQAICGTILAECRHPFTVIKLTHSCYTYRFIPTMTSNAD